MQLQNFLLTNIFIYLLIAPVNGLSHITVLTIAVTSSVTGFLMLVIIIIVAKVLTKRKSNRRQSVTINESFSTSKLYSESFIDQQLQQYIDESFHPKARCSTTSLDLRLCDNDHRYESLNTLKKYSTIDDKHSLASFYFDDGLNNQDTRSICSIATVQIFPEVYIESEVL